MSEQRRERTERGTGPRILILDEQGLLREGLEMLLRHSSADYAVAVALPVPEEALKLVEQAPPDVILSAGATTVRAALETARMIRLRCPQAKLIVLGDYLFAGAVREALRVGAMGFLTKDSPFADLES